MTVYKHVIWDDLREFAKTNFNTVPPQEDVLYLRTEKEGIEFLLGLNNHDVIETLYLDHDLGLDVGEFNHETGLWVITDTKAVASTRRGCFALAERAAVTPEILPKICTTYIVSANPSGARYLFDLAQIFSDHAQIKNAEDFGLFVLQGW